MAHIDGISEFVETLRGVRYSCYVEEPDESKLDVVADKDRYADVCDVLTAGDWSLEGQTESDEAVSMTFSRSESHEMETACVLTPHIISDPDENPVHEDPGDEVTEQGYHRQVAWVECECGQRFDGRSAYQDWQEHNNEHTTQ